MLFSHGRELIGTGRYSFEEETRPDGIRSVLIIGETIPDDFGEYNCTVKNSHGQDSLTFRLEQQSEHTCESQCSMILFLVRQVWTKIWQN